MNIPFAIANYLWTLFGEDDLDMIAFYNDRARSFSPDGKHLVGSIGKRIFHHEGIDQFSVAILRLREDSASRRVVLQMFSPTDLLDPPLDTPCSAAFQWLVRNGQLHWITYMRSQSAAMVLPYDLFVFTMLQETASLALGVQMGLYHHFCGSLHYYADEEPVVTAMLAEPPVSIIPTMPAMDANPLECIAELKSTEKRMREALSARTDCLFLRSTGLSPYWVALFSMMAIMVQRRLGIPLTKALMDELPEPFRYLVHDG